MIDGGHGEFPLGQALGRPAQGEFRDIYSGNFGRTPGGGQGLVQPGGVVPLAAAAVQQGGGGEGLALLRRPGTQGIPQRGVVAPVQKGGAGGHHGLVVPGIFGVLPVGGEQMGIAGRSHVEAVAAGAEIALLLPGQGGGAQGASE